MNERLLEQYHRGLIPESDLEPIEQLEEKPPDLRSAIRLLSASCKEIHHMRSRPEKFDGQNKMLLKQIKGDLHTATVWSREYMINLLKGKNK